MPLTPNEQAVLGVLMSAKGRVVSRAELNALALGYHEQTSSRALDATIGRLRKKIERDVARPEHILSVYGRGYRLHAEIAEPPPAPARRPTWLATRFVGRSEELARLEAALADTRAVVLSGVSGVGKSRLIAEYVRLRGEAYVGGTAWADLSGARSTADALLRASGALGLAAREASVEQLAGEIASALHASDLRLLVVDGAERLLADLEPWLSLWLAAPSLHLVVTTRVQTGLAGWTVYTLEGLSTADATTLLRDRTDLALQYEPEDAERLVAHLDGLPLAVEFAATRLRVVGMRPLLRALERGALTGAESPVLVEAVEWALGTLSPLARDAVQAATVFEGAFGFDAFEAVCMPANDATGPEVVEELLDRCLLRRDSADGEVRFALYGAVRRALREPLADARRAHAHWFAEQADAAPEVWAIDLAYMRATRASFEDHLAAWRWAIEAPDPRLAARLALGVSPYLHHTGPVALHLELLEGAGKALEDARLSARLHLAAAGAHMANTDEAATRRSLVNAWRHLRHGHSNLHGRLHHLIGKVEWRRKAGMARWFVSAIELMREAGDRAGAALVQADLAQRTLSRALGATPDAPVDLSELDRAADLATATGNVQAVLLVDWAKSYVHRSTGQVEAARATLETVRDRFLELGSVANAYSVEMSLAHLAWWSVGDFAALSAHLRAARRIAAGFLAARLELVQAEASYEALLDERARAPMVRALNLAAHSPELADHVLTLQIRLALLDSEPEQPARTVVRLRALRDEALRRQDRTAVSEIEVAITLLWARAGCWREAEQMLDSVSALDADHPDAEIRQRLVTLLRMAVASALGSAKDAEVVWRAALSDGPGRLSRIAAAMLVARGAPTTRILLDDAPRGSVLPHEVLLAEQVAGRLAQC